MRNLCLWNLWSCHGKMSEKYLWSMFLPLFKFTKSLVWANEPSPHFINSTMGIRSLGSRNMNSKMPKKMGHVSKFPASRARCPHNMQEGNMQKTLQKKPFWKQKQRSDTVGWTKNANSPVLLWKFDGFKVILARSPNNTPKWKHLPTSLLELLSYFFSSVRVCLQPPLFRLYNGQTSQVAVLYTETLV